MTTQEIIKFIEERKDSSVRIFKAVSNSDKAQESTKMFSHGEMYALTTILDDIKQRIEQPTSKVEVLNGMQQYFKEKNLIK